MFEIEICSKPLASILKVRQANILWLSCWFKAAKVLLKSKISIHWYPFLHKQKIFLRRFFLCECRSILKNWHHFPHQIVPDPDAILRKKTFQNNNKTKIHIKLRLKSVGLENLNLLTFLMTETVGKFSLDYLVVALCTTTYIVVDSALATTTTISDHIVSRNRWVAVRGASVRIANVTFWFELTLKTYVCTRRSRCEVNSTRRYKY